MAGAARKPLPQPRDQRTIIQAKILIKFSFRLKIIELESFVFIISALRVDFSILKVVTIDIFEGIVILINFHILIFAIVTF